MLPLVVVAVDTGAAQTLPRSDSDSARVQHVSRSWLLLAGKAKPKAQSEVSLCGKSAIFTVIAATNPIAIPIPIDCHSSWALMLMKPTAG